MEGYRTAHRCLYAMSIEPDKAQACHETWKPRIIVCLGCVAAQRIISPDFKITRRHGTWTYRKNCVPTGTGDHRLEREQGLRKGAYQ